MNPSTIIGILAVVLFVIIILWLLGRHKVKKLTDELIMERATNQSLKDINLAVKKQLDIAATPTTTEDAYQGLKDTE